MYACPLDWCPQFNMMKKANGRSVLLTDAQQKWMVVQRMLSAASPRRKSKPPTNVVRRWIYDAVISEFFDNFMIVVILANVVSMCMTHEGESAAWVFALSMSNVVFTGIFVIEMLLKWIALGLPAYFKVIILANVTFCIAFHSAYR